MEPRITSINGSLLEGGGQILRISVALSSLLGIPIRIFNIRGQRTSPGLKAQHKAGIDLVSEMTPGSALSGSEIGSSEITFKPLRSDNVPEQKKMKQQFYFSADTKTAGSTCLLAQISLPKALFMGGRCSLTLGGGTDVPMAPTHSYLQEVFIPNLMRFGLPEDPIIALASKGYCPRGGGSVSIDIRNPPEGPLSPVQMMERGDISCVRIISSASGIVPLVVAKEMCASAREVIKRELKEPNITIKEEVCHEGKSKGNGSSITLVANSSQGCVFGGSALGSHKVKPSVTGAEAANDLLASIKTHPRSCVDEYSQDQLILYMALAKGTSRIRTSYPLTLHTQTAIKVVETLTSASFTLTTEKIDGHDYCVIECEGIAFQV